MLRMPPLKAAVLVHGPDSPRSYAMDGLYYNAAYLRHNSLDSGLGLLSESNGLMKDLTLASSLPDIPSIVVPDGTSSAGIVGPGGDRSPAKSTKNICTFNGSVLQDGYSSCHGDSKRSFDVESQSGSIDDSLEAGFTEVALQSIGMNGLKRPPSVPERAVAENNASVRQNDRPEKSAQRRFIELLPKHIFPWKSKETSPPATSGSLLRKPSTESTDSDTGKGSSPQRTLRSRKSDELVASSTTALILEQRPPNLPAKSASEEMKHRLEYEKMVEVARKKEVRKAKLRKKQLQEQYRHEEKLSATSHTWNEDILPAWESIKHERRVRDLWWQGLPPSVRGKVWKLAIGNDLNITPELYEICRSRAHHRIRFAAESASLLSEEDCCDNESTGSSDKEATVELIKLDVSRTFPQLCIFQKGGPYHDLLHSLLGAYVCHRPDVGYIQGMSFLAAVLILNLDVADAFTSFCNLLNRPLHLAFFRLDKPMMRAYFLTYCDFFYENLPRLYVHFEQQHVTPDLYLIDWIYTIYSRSLPLDVACRVWDVFIRDGEEFLFRTALGVLHLYHDLLLGLDFIHLAQFLTRLPEDVGSDPLFHSIACVHLSLPDKRRFSHVLATYISSSATDS